MNVKELLEIYDKHENMGSIQSGCGHEEQESITEAYRKTSCERAAKLREIVELLPEIKRALGRTKGGKPTVRRWGMAIKDKLDKWENS